MSHSDDEQHQQHMAQAIIDALVQQRNEALNREANKDGIIAGLQRQLHLTQERLEKLEAAIREKPAQLMPLDEADEGAMGRPLH